MKSGVECRIYSVAADWLSRRANEPKDAEIRKAIGQLIARYDLRHKRILSLGCGYCLEARWLAALGQNRITGIDIDEHGSIERYLEAAPPGSHLDQVG